MPVHETVIVRGRATCDHKDCRAYIEKEASPARHKPEEWTRAVKSTHAQMKLDGWQECSSGLWWFCPQHRRDRNEIKGHSLQHNLPSP